MLGWILLQHYFGDDEAHILKRDDDEDDENMNDEEDTSDRRLIDVFDDVDVVGNIVGDDDVFFDIDEIEGALSDSSGDDFRSASSRLGSLSKDTDSTSPKKDKDKDEKQFADLNNLQGLIQRCVVLQRDERGYGLTVSGENPVFVESVKENGAAHRSGVREGDKILKVNGTLVAGSNHKEVVRLIKSGSYVALTLLGRPPGTPSKETKDLEVPPSPNQKPSAGEKNKITGPQPVDIAKNQQFRSEKAVTLRIMYEQALRDYEKVKRDSQRNPSDKLMARLSDHEKRLKILEAQLQSAAQDSPVSPDHRAGFYGAGNKEVTICSATPAPPPGVISCDRSERYLLCTREIVSANEDGSQFISLRQSSTTPVQSPHDVGHSYNIPMDSSLDEGVDMSSGHDSTPGDLPGPGDDPVSWLPDGPRHKKTGSMPDTLMDNDGGEHNRAIPRSVSDVGSQQKHHRTLSGSDSCPHLTNIKRTESEKSRTPSLPTSMYDSGSLSDSQSPQHSPIPSPTPMQQQGIVEYVEPSEVREEVAKIHEPVTVSTVPRLKSAVIEHGPVEPMQLKTAQIHTVAHTEHIMNMEEDEFSADEEVYESSQPFNDLASLKDKPAHLTVFLNYMISNSDPSPLLFYLVTEGYTQGSAKDMRKWAYEIHSTFLAEKAPLRVSVDDNIVQGIENVLSYKYEKEDQLRLVFQHARHVANNQINDVLTEFRDKRKLGLASMYGENDLHNYSLPRSEELRIIEQIIYERHLKRLLSIASENKHQYRGYHVEDEDASDRNTALLSAIVTFLKQIGATSRAKLLERVPTYVEKDKKFILKFNKTNKKAHMSNGHACQAQHYYVTTFCNHCSGLLWGIGYQGYQCTTCDQNYHKNCLDFPPESCSTVKKRSNRKSVFDKIATGIRKPSVNSAQAIPSYYNPTPVEKAQRLHDAKEEERGSGTPTGSVSTSLLGNTVKEATEEEELDNRSTNRHSLLVERYNANSSSEDNKPSRSPRSTSPMSDEDKKDEGRNSSVNINRSESLKGTRPKDRSGSVKRTNSDVSGDKTAINQALDQTSSSSNSSLSAKSESPSTSSEAVNQLPPTSLNFNDDSDFEGGDELPLLDELLGKDTVRKLKPKERKRQEVINELFFTEKTHTRALKLLDKLFYRPWHADNSLPKDLVKSLFPNLGELLEMHVSLNDSMKEVQKRNPVVEQVGDILLDRFDGENGIKFRKCCAKFCQSQSYALESLKRHQAKKDHRVAMFIAEAESHPLCRKLLLREQLPKQMQRLTKYRLLIENLLKYTPSSQEEHTKLQRALECCKEILDFVNSAVKEFENHQRLVELQKRTEKRLENCKNSDAEAFKNLDFTKCRMIYEGSMTWRLNRNKQIEVQGVMLEDILVLLQKSDDKYILKCQNTTQFPGKEDTKFTHSPIIQLKSILTRNVAADKRAFFLISTLSTAGPQIYELVAISAEERKRWVKHITETAAILPRGGSTSMPIHEPTTPVSVVSMPSDAEKPDAEKVCERKISEPEPDYVEMPPIKMGSTESLDKVGKVSMLQVTQEPELITPTEVCVTNPVYSRAEPILSPLEKLRQKDDIIERALREKHRILADMFGVPVEEFEHVAENPPIPPNLSVDFNPMASEFDEERGPNELVLSAITQVGFLMQMVKDALTAPPESNDSSPRALSDIRPSTTTQNLKLALTLPSGDLLKVVSNLGKNLGQLRAVMTEQEHETSRLQHELKVTRRELVSSSPKTSRPNSFLSNASSASETADVVEESVVPASDESALFSPPPASELSINDDNGDEPLLMAAVSLEQSVDDSEEIVVAAIETDIVVEEVIDDDDSKNVADDDDDDVTVETTEEYVTDILDNVIDKAVEMMTSEKEERVAEDLTEGKDETDANVDGSPDDRITDATADTSVESSV
ncbi:rho guanine nucleotide exchange factor 11-like [Tubulanus polymorphus]|uniref:rho guanine nucleotide exchange factor 11-like n=1 Tax=Tubulanus polymorphus TaxID=672921 RepID=UPI003DA29E7E